MKRGNLPTSSALSGTGEHWIEKYFLFFSYLKALFKVVAGSNLSVNI